MISHRRNHDALTTAMVNEVLDALGLCRASRGDPFGPIWDRIAEVCRLPNCEQLRQGMDGPGTEVLPATVWNLAVDYANRVASR